MNLRTWLWDQLSTLAVPVHSSGSLTRRPENEPIFLVVTFMPSVPGPFPGVEIQRVQVWAHDVDLSYVAIDELLKDIRTILRHAVSVDDLVAVTWEGESNDLEDEALETRTRYAMFRLSAKDEL